MNIGFLTPEYPLKNSKVGGVGTYIKKSASELTDRGHKITVFLESTRNAKLNDNGVTIYEIKCPPLYYALNSKSFLKQLIRVSYILFSAFKIKNKVFQIHKKDPFNILQSSNYLAPGFFLKKNKKIPVITRVSSYAPLWHAAFGIPRTFGDYLIDYLELRQVTDAQSSFSPSRFMRKVYARYENCKLNFIPTPLDINKPIKKDNFLLEKILRKLPSKQYILYFGSLSRIKGVDLMADVINKLSPKHPKLGFVFVGVDYGLPDGKPLSEFIYGQCQKYKKQILFFTYQPRKRLHPVIKNAYGIAAPSRVDNYPNTCLEAQTLGIPVIGTNNSSIDEIIIDGKTGFIAENSSPTSIASKVESLLEMSKKERLEMQKEIAKNISCILKEDRIKILIKYYEKVIKEYKEQNK